MTAEAMPSTGRTERHDYPLSDVERSEYSAGATRFRQHVASGITQLQADLELLMFYVNELLKDFNARLKR
jgi:hypothetical protein